MGKSKSISIIIARKCEGAGYEVIGTGEYRLSGAAHSFPIAACADEAQWEHFYRIVGNFGREYMAKGTIETIHFHDEAGVEYVAQLV